MILNKSDCIVSLFPQGDSICPWAEQDGRWSEVLLHGLLHPFLSKNEIQGCPKNPENLPTCSSF